MPRLAGSPKHSDTDVAQAGEPLGDGGRLAWILGSSRSGSTWTLRMLSALNEVVPIDDPHIGHHLSVWRPISLAWATAAESQELTTLPELKADTPSYFFSDRYREAWQPALRELITARFAAEARDVAADRGIDNPFVVVKDPGASGVASLVSSLFPRSRLVFLLRDGRDVVDSWLDGYSHDSWGLREGTYPLSDDGRLAFIRWQSSVWATRTRECLAALEEHPADRGIIVHYEHLHSDTVRTLMAICEVMGVSATTRTLSEIAKRYSYGKVPAERKGSGHEIRWAAPGSWRHNMTDREIAAMHEIMGPVLSEVGYLGNEPGRRRGIA